jgi:hypothetical protein
LTITAQSRGSIPFTLPRFGGFDPLPGILTLGFGTLLGITWLRKNRLSSFRYTNRIPWNGALGLVLVCFLAFSISCGGGSGSSRTTGNTSGGSTPVTGNVTVQGVNGNTSHSVRVSVTVN